MLMMALALSNDVARLAAHLPYQEIDARSRCILGQITRDLALPPKIDCLREVDPQYPNTGRGITDNNVVEAHNHVLRSIPNACPWPAPPWRMGSA